MKKKTNHQITALIEVLKLCLWLQSDLVQKKRKKEKKKKKRITHFELLYHPEI